MSSLGWKNRFVAFSSGGSNRGRDRDQQAAARRNQIRYLRDIGDQASIDRLDQPRRRKPKGWLLFAILAIVIYSGYRAFGGAGTATVAITTNCQTPGLTVASQKVAIRSELPWSATGPETGRYVLVADGGAVTVAGSRVHVVGGAPATGIFTAHRCLAHGRLTSPGTTGKHALRLIHIVGTKATQVAKVDLTVIKQPK